MASIVLLLLFIADPDEEERLITQRQHTRKLQNQVSNQACRTWDGPKFPLGCDEKLREAASGGGGGGALLPSSHNNLMQIVTS